MALFEKSDLFVREGTDLHAVDHHGADGKTLSEQGRG
jgi:hypothetical protein